MIPPFSLTPRPYSWFTMSYRCTLWIHGKNAHGLLHFNARIRRFLTTLLCPNRGLDYFQEYWSGGDYMSLFFQHEFDNDSKLSGSRQPSRSKNPT